MPISYTQGSNKYYLHYDQVGSLRAISDNNHNIVKEIVYDSFGNIVSDSNPNIKVPFAFAGGLYDEDTKLLRFGYRDYDSYTGKWTAKDPIDFDGDGYNLYGYVLNDPVNFVDTLGLFSNDMIQQAQANALAMERSIPSWRQPKYQTHNAIRNIHIQGVKGSIAGATLLSDYGPAGVAAGATIGYAGGMCYGAWKESGLPSIPDEVEYLPGGKFLK